MFGKEQSGLNRKVSIANGDKTYLSITPCKKCGGFVRYVSSFGCQPCGAVEGLKKLMDVELMAPYRTASTKAAKTYRYRARKRGATAPGADKKAIRQFYIEAERLTSLTGIPHQVDHIMPLAKGGLHHQDNLQVLTREENARKRDRI